MSMLKSTRSIKRAVGSVAAGLIKEGMVLGVGTGTTASCFIQALIDRCKEGLNVTAVATSTQSERQAQRGGIKVVSIDDVDEIDLVIDGADEIDGDRRLIKGGGGALLREKVVAMAAKEMIVIVDETKLVDKLGTFGLPLEVVPFGHSHTLKQLNDWGMHGVIRTTSSGAPFVTDNMNYVIDLTFTRLIDDPKALDEKLRALPGVVETGLFIGIAGRVIVGYEDGRVEIT